MSTRWDAETDKWTTDKHGETCRQTDAQWSDDGWNFPTSLSVSACVCVYVEMWCIHQSVRSLRRRGCLNLNLSSIRASTTVTRRPSLGPGWPTARPTGTHCLISKTHQSLCDVYCLSIRRPCAATWLLNHFNVNDWMLANLLLSTITCQCQPKQQLTSALLLITEKHSSFTKARSPICSISHQSREPARALGEGFCCVCSVLIVGAYVFIVIYFPTNMHQNEDFLIYDFENFHGVIPATLYGGRG